MATTAPSTNPLAESLAQVTGVDPLSTTAGTSPIGYDPDLAFRAPEGDIISITGDPGTGASQAETWSHELSLEQLQQDQLEFEYAMQQDLLDQSYQQQQYQLQLSESQRAAQSLANQQSQWASEYALQQAEADRAAALSPYEIEAASLANQSAAYALPAQQAEAQAAQRQMDTNKAMYEKGMAQWDRNMKTPGFTWYDQSGKHTVAGAPYVGYTSGSGVSGIKW